MFEFDPEVPTTIRVFVYMSVALIAFCVAAILSPIGPAIGAAIAVMYVASVIAAWLEPKSA